MEISERRAKDLEVAMLLVADDLGIVAFEVAAIGGREVVFRVDAISRSTFTSISISRCSGQSLSTNLKSDLGHDREAE